MKNIPLNVLVKELFLKIQPCGALQFSRKKKPLIVKTAFFCPNKHNSYNFTILKCLELKNNHDHFFELKENFVQK